MAKPNDDLEAVRALIEALSGFDSAEQERIIRWAREKLGLSTAPATPPSAPGAPGSATPAARGGSHTDIRSFIAAKKPKTDNQFAAAVAYYYRFEAPPAEQKQTINANDLQEACRKAGRDRLNKPIMTLFNAQKTGLLDKAGKGEFALNTVGENLVAMTLPHGDAKPAGPGSRAARLRAKKSKRPR
jgi:hypothetical protein